MIFPEEMKIEAAEAYRQNILVPGFEHVHRNDWINAWCCGVTYQSKKQQEEGWRTDEPPRGERIELLCVLFDEDEYRTLQKNSWDDEYNRSIVTGTWNGSYFRGEINHASGDPFPKVVAWRPIEENWGAPFYPRCLGECRD